MSDTALVSTSAIGFAVGASASAEPGGVCAMPVQSATWPPAELPPTTMRLGSMPSSAAWSWTQRTAARASATDSSGEVPKRSFTR